MARTSTTGVTKARLEWDEILTCDRCVWPGLKLRDAKEMLDLLHHGGYVGRLKREQGNRYRVELGLRIGQVVHLKLEQRQDGWLLTEWAKACPKCDKVFKEPRNQYYSPTLAQWELEDALHNAD